MRVRRLFCREWLFGYLEPERRVRNRDIWCESPFCPQLIVVIAKLRVASAAAAPHHILYGIGGSPRPVVQAPRV